MTGILVLIFSGIICFLCVLKWDVDEDYKKWLGAVEVMHAKEAWVRVTYLILPYFCFSSAAFCGIVLKDDTRLSLIIACIILPAIMMGVNYNLFFDGWYNAKRGFGFWFNGSARGKKDDSVIDQFWRKVPARWERIIRIGLSVISIGAYIFLFI